MTREQQINKAAFANSNNLSEVISFVRGARWADEHPNIENLWHDVSEKPKGNSEIMVQWRIKENTGCETFHTPSYANWTNFLEKYGVSRWAYIDDLLPKQFGNSEQLKGGKK